MNAYFDLAKRPTQSYCALLAFKEIVFVTVVLEWRRKPLMLYKAITGFCSKSGL